MFAKLFSRITESSLMEQPVTTRYAFMTLLAIADPQGNVFATDHTLARRLNLPLPDLQEALRNLGAPDPESHTPTQEGRRIVPLEQGTGYRIVNYLTYRNLRDEGQRRAYMRSYMAEKRRQPKAATANHTTQGLTPEPPVNPVATVNPVNSGKPLLAHAEAEAEADTEADKDVGRDAAASPASEVGHWLGALQQNPAYAGIDVAREYGKMLCWCEANRKKPTRRRFINWLNRTDPPLSSAPGRLAPPPAPFTGEIHLPET